MRRSVALFAMLASLSLGGCDVDLDGEDPDIGGQVATIIGGAETQGDPAVVFLQTPGGLCTGTLIAPEVVLTAAHCINDAIDAGQTSSGNVSFGSGQGNFFETIGVRDMAIHRRYNPTQLRLFDIGLVRIANPPDSVTPMAFNVDSADEYLGVQARVIGFGVTDGEAQTGAGTKRQILLTIDQVTAEHMILGSPGRNICQGDSGGPTVINIDGTPTVMAVSSFGSNACMDPSFVTRTDRYNPDFLAPVLAAWDGPCAADGQCSAGPCEFVDPDCDICGFDGICGQNCEKVDFDCPLGGLAGDLCDDEFDCEGRLCVEATDDPRIEYCTDSCVTDDDCIVPLGVCTDGLCRPVGPTPSAQGSSCFNDSECRSGICDEEFAICGEPCANSTECADPYTCENVSGGKVCTFASEGGCCSISGGIGHGTETGFLAFLVALIALACPLRRRRRRSR